MSKGTLRGYSLSFCIADLVSGSVCVDAVAEIRASTCARDERDWDLLLSQYSLIYWRSNPELARQYVSQLRAEGKISQPRLEDPTYSCHVSRDPGIGTHGVWEQVD